MSLPIFPSLSTMAWNSKKTQRWDTKVQKSGSGRRKTLSRFAYPEWGIDCAFTCLNTDEIKQMVGFFAQVHGQHLPFLWKDPEDYREENTRIGTGNGITTSFQLVKNFADHFVEPVYDIIPGTLLVFVDGASVDFIEEDGLVILAVPPVEGAIVTATFEYYWRVAFDDDELDWDVLFYNIFKVNKFKLVTVR